MNNRTYVLAGGGYRYDYAVCLLRIVACCLIVWNHLSGHMLDGRGNPLSLANIGVQIFFFMSGWLYSKQEILNPVDWIKHNLIKIYIPYWLSLILLLPMIAGLTVGNVTLKGVLAAFLGIQGFGFTIGGIGQHWFVSYIIICYLITPTVLFRLKSKFKNKCIWVWLAFAAIIAQAITIPFAILFQFKVAYIFNYVIGYVYGVRYATNSGQDKKIFDSFIIFIAILGIGIRIYLAEINADGLMENVCDVVTQWIRVIQGCAFFIIFTNLLSLKMDGLPDSVKKCLKRISEYTYEVYLVHEFFTMNMFTDLLKSSIGIKVVIVLSVIVIATVVLVVMEKIINGIKCNIRKGIRK